MTIENDGFSFFFFSSSNKFRNYFPNIIIHMIKGDKSIVESWISVYTRCSRGAARDWQNLRHVFSRGWISRLQQKHADNARGLLRARDTKKRVARTGYTQDVFRVAAWPSKWHLQMDSRSGKTSPWWLCSAGCTAAFKLAPAQKDTRGRHRSSSSSISSPLPSPVRR